MKFQAKITKRLADTRKCDPMIEIGFSVYKVVDQKIVFFGKQEAMVDLFL